MQAAEFVESLKVKIVDKSIDEYKQMFDKSGSATDPVWKAMLVMYNSFSDEEKKAFLTFIRLVKANTLSALFGVLDGSSFLSDHKETFVLTSESDGETLNGSLQDIFWEMEEDSNE